MTIAPSALCSRVWNLETCRDRNPRAGCLPDTGLGRSLRGQAGRSPAVRRRPDTEGAARRDALPWMIRLLPNVTKQVARSGHVFLCAPPFFMLSPKRCGQKWPAFCARGILFKPPGGRGQKWPDIRARGGILVALAGGYAVVQVRGIAGGEECSMRMRAAPRTAPVRSSQRAHGGLHEGKA